MQDLLNLNGSAPLSLESLVINLLLAMVLSVLVAWFYVRYGQSLSNRGRFANNLPALTLTTVLIISVVKSSLALSLGLVGALSIVRFRTAIKEPEELVFLFLSIAIGLGMGADQRLPTLVAILIILAFLFVRSQLGGKAQQNNLYFNFSNHNNDATVADINKLLATHTQSADLRRVDNNAGILHTTYLIRLPHDTALVTLMDALRQQFPDADFTFVEQDNTLGG